jgi:cytochrome P450
MIIEHLGLSRVEVMNEMLAFLAAGYGTTSTSVSWFIYYMSKNPQVQKKMKQELAELNGQRFSLEQLDSFIYLDCVLREVFRLVSPTLGTVRTLTTDDQLPGSGAQLKKGESVFISFYPLARDKRYWSDLYDLNEFHPERYLDDPEHKNNLSALMAFGGGHRQCMGQDLARFELKIICARLMQFVTFGDGGPELNAGGHDVTDTNKPRKIGVTITFD